MLNDHVFEASRVRTISASSQAIWDVLADFGALSSWVDGVDHSSVLNDGPGGTLLGTSRRVQVGRNVLVERITEAEPPVRLCYEITGLPKQLRYVANRWTLRPAGDATLVRVTSIVEIGANPLSRIAERLVCRLATKQSDAMLTGLTRRMESAHA